MNETEPSAPAASRVVPERALAAVDGDRNLLRELAAIFAEDSPRMVETLRGAIDSASAKTVADAAHALKGAVGVFGADEAVALAYDLEKQGRSGDLARSRDVFARLGVEVAAVAAELAALTGLPA